MKNIYSNILKPNNKNLIKIINILQKDGVVGLPTETVYGLAGNAYSSKAIKKIYQLKKRPKKNPLIIHYLDAKNAEKDVILNKTFYKIYKKYSPGPITYIVKKKLNSKIKLEANNKLDTIGIRFPKNKIIRNILRNSKFPFAMPSANISSGISPVKAKDVSEEFKNKIKVLDGGISDIGIESTVVKLFGNISILRPGKITPLQLKKILQKNIKVNFYQKIIRSPGLLKKHYSPNIPMKLNQTRSPREHAFITFGSKYPVTRNSFNLSKKSNLNEAAKNLYKFFRNIKKKGFKKIYVARIPNTGVGYAINDRLKRASKK